MNRSTLNPSAVSRARQALLGAMGGRHLAALAGLAAIVGLFSDPTLELFDRNGVSIASNDNWADTQQAEIAATGIPPSNPRESAILRTLAPGGYTAVVRGANNSTGVAVVEVYALP